MIRRPMDGIQRPFTRIPNALNLGPTGARLWATYVHAEPGFRGSFEFIHKVNCPELFTVGLMVDGREVPLQCVSHRWYPDRLETDFAGDGLRLSETKFITWDDCAVDVISVTGASAKDVRLDIEFGPQTFEAHGEKVFVHGGQSGAEATHSMVVAALGHTEAEADRALARWLQSEDPVREQKAAYDDWFAGAPDFECSDPAFEKMWDYRWYLVRRNLADPRRGNLAHPLYYEGRGVKMTMDPWKPVGWEFSKLIPFGTVFHVLEGRWHRDTSACKGEILDLIANQRDDGLFRCAYTDSHGGSYTDLTAWAAWQLYLVEPDKDWLAEVAPALVRQVDGTVAVFDDDGDYLPTVFDHGTTGKEYQPSFFHKAGYPERPGKSQATPLERVDAACYLYMNAGAAAAIAREMGDEPEAERLTHIANQVKASVLALMWNAKEQFFYDIDAVTHEQVPVESVVGFDPFMAGIADEQHLAAFDRLTDPEQFGAEWPVPSVSKRCAAYAPDASWRGEHIKGERGCVWNGPTWPFTNSTVLMALANAGRMTGGTLNGAFAHSLRRYTAMCFRNGSLDDPMIYEHYNPETGQPISQEEDYFHSSWIDLIVRYVAGITPMSGGGIEFHPVDIGLDWFRLSGVRVGARTVDVEYHARTGYARHVTSP